MKPAFALALACLLAASCKPSHGPEVVLDEAWVRAAPQGAPMAGYFRIHNGTAAVLSCDRASSPDFGAIEIHRSLIEDGMSRMLRDQVLEVAPGAEGRAEPGGLHLMLFRPQRPLVPGDQSRITLQCGDQHVSADFRVRAD